MDEFSLIKRLFGLDEAQGFSEEEIGAVTNEFGAISPVLERYYREFGKAPLLNMQDGLLFPPRTERDNGIDYFTFYIENQGAYSCGIRCRELAGADPPVYSTEGQTWELQCEKLSTFFLAINYMQAALVLDFEEKCEEEYFYALSAEELHIVEENFEKKPEHLHLFDTDVAFYANDPDSIIVIMRIGEDIQLSYSANNEQSYDKMRSVLGDLGEPI
jgi:hypothetical protein